MKLLFYPVLLVTLLIAQLALSSKGRPFADPMLIGVIWIGFFRGSTQAALFGFAAGWCLDCLADGYLGVWALVFTITGFLAGTAERFIDTRAWMQSAVGVFALTLIYNALACLFFTPMSGSFSSLCRQILQNALLTAFAATIAFRLFRRRAGRSEIAIR